MRIAFFCPHSDPLAPPGEPDAGGQCVYEAEVAKQLARMGHEVRAYTRQWNDKPACEPIVPGAAVYRYPMGPPGFLRKEDMGPHLAEFLAAVVAGQGGWLAAADLCHGHYWDGGVAALAAAAGFGKPLLFTSHSLGMLKRDRVPDPEPDGSRFRYDLRIAAETRVLRAADAVVALSGDERRALTGRYGTAPGNIAVVPGGVDLDGYHPCDDKRALQRELGFEGDHLLFATGRLDPRKGFLELLESIPLVLKRLRGAGRTATFCLPAGPARPSRDEAQYRDALRGRAAELGIESAIHWFQRLGGDQLKIHYRAADLFLCPSPYEPFGLVLVEAFASGTPAVATCRGGPVDIVSHGIDGYLADPLDPAAFATAIADAVLAPEPDRQAMREAALVKARSRYSWPAVTERLAALYAKVAAGEAVI